MNRQGRATCYGLVTVLLWSTVATAFKRTLRHLEPMELLLWACLASIVVLAAILAVQGRLGHLMPSLRRSWRRSLGLGLINPFLYYVVLFEAYHRLPAQEAQPLNYTWGITLTLLSIPLLKQRIRRAEVAAILVSYAGVVVIATRGDLAGLQFSDPLGVGLALGSTVLWSLYWIYSTKDDRDPVVGLLGNFLFGFPFILAACALSGNLRLPPLPGLLGAAYVGAFEMGITFVTWLTALKLAKNTGRVASLIFLSPFLSLVFIHYLVGEEILGSTYAGLVLIVGGLVLQRVVGGKRAGATGS